MLFEFLVLRMGFGAACLALVGISPVRMRTLLIILGIVPPAMRKARRSQIATRERCQHMCYRRPRASSQFDFRLCP